MLQRSGIKQIHMKKRYELQNEELESFIIIPIKKGIILLSHG